MWEELAERIYKIHQSNAQHDRLTLPNWEELDPSVKQYMVQEVQRVTFITVRLLVPRKYWEK